MAGTREERAAKRYGKKEEGDSKPEGNERPAGAGRDGAEHARKKAGESPRKVENDHGGEHMNARHAIEMGEMHERHAAEHSAMGKRHVKERKAHTGDAESLKSMHDRHHEEHAQIAHRHLMEHHQITRRHENEIAAPAMAQQMAAAGEQGAPGQGPGNSPVPGGAAI